MQGGLSALPSSPTTWRQETGIPSTDELFAAATVMQRATVDRALPGRMPYMV